jgi:glucosyl-dolichyl phosphate glucuronosyltransferase
MKVFCLVIDINDHQWLSEYWQNRSPGDEIVVVAPTFDGRLIADSLGIPYKAHEEIAWAQDRPAIQDIARHKARYWHEIPELENNVQLRSVKEFNGYPLLCMHQSLMLLGINEIIQSHQYINAVLEIEKPDSILFGVRKNPFLGAPLEYIFENKGVEREVLQSILNRNLHGSLAQSKLDEIKTASPPVRTYPEANATLFHWPEELTGPRILIFAWTYYYLEYFDRVLDLLLQNKARICVVIVGGELSAEQQSVWLSKGVCSFLKTGWAAPNEEQIWTAWKAKCDNAVDSIYDSPALRDYFSDNYGSFFPGLVSDLLCRQVVETASTVVELLRSESIIRAFQPDMVLSHFSFHPQETCDVLPARRLGIPTLSMDHGINGFTDSQRLTFATEYYGTSGSSFRQGVLMAVQAPENRISVIGNTRYDLFAPRDISKADAKRHFGMDPERPLCIFCDSSGWSHVNQWRYSISATVTALIRLKNCIPGLQLIYRVHHGGEFQGLKAFFERAGIPDLHFQMSLDSRFADIVPAADIVVSHYTSAVAEALLSGVPVIYLTACGEPEPSYFNCPAIQIADSFDSLPFQVTEALKANLSRSEVRRVAQPYFDTALAGNDGKASERLVGLILKLASTPDSERTQGFQDWLDRIDSSCRFDTKEFRTLIPHGKTSGSKQPFVSVIMPAYNRAHMIGITLESFINQDYPKDRYEIIVSDNNSTDATKAVVLEWQSKSQVPITYIFEGRQGVHYARNTAAKQSRGDILYYTDDDMIAEPDLLSEIVKVFDLDPMVGTATGRVLPKWEAQPPEWILQLCYNGYLSIFDELGDGMIIEDNDLGVYSCHQAIRREVFFKSGGYNPESTYTDYIGDGETGLNNKIRALGYKFGYNGKSVIHHMIPPGRMTQDYLNKRLANQGSADSYTEFKRNCYSREELAQRIKFYQNAVLECSAQAVLGRLNGNEQWRLDKAYAHYYLNRIEYDIRLMEDEAWRELVMKDNWIDE